MSKKVTILAAVIAVIVFGAAYFLKFVDSPKTDNPTEVRNEEEALRIVSDYRDSIGEPVRENEPMEARRVSDGWIVAYGGGKEYKIDTISDRVEKVTQPAPAGSGPGAQPATSAKIEEAFWLQKGMAVKIEDIFTLVLSDIVKIPESGKIFLSLEVVGQTLSENGTPKRTTLYSETGPKILTLQDFATADSVYTLEFLRDLSGMPADAHAFKVQKKFTQ